MGRIRTVKPELFTHEDLYNLEISSGYPIRTAFAGLFTCCDKEGRFKWKANTLKLGCLPFDKLDFSRVLDALWTAGFIVKYEVQSVEYGYIPTWSKHQFINNREAASELPEPHESLILSITCTHESRDIDASSTRLEGKGREGKGREGDREGERKESTPLSNASTALPKKPVLDDPIDLLGDADQKVPELALSIHCHAEQVFKHWQDTMGHPQAKLDAKRKRNIAARLKDGYSVDQLMLAINGCKFDAFSQGANDRHAVYDDIELICRDGPKVDKFIKIAMRGPPQAHNGMSKNTNMTIDNINRVLERRKNEKCG